MTLAIDDEDDFRARGVQGISSLDLPTLREVKRAPKGISGTSSIDEVEKEAPPPSHRPLLESPRTHYMYDLLQAHRNFEKSTERSAELFDEQVKKDLKEMDRLTIEKEEALRKEAEAAAQRDTWGTLSNIAQYIAGAGTLALASAFSGLPSYLLVGSAVIGIGNRLLKDTNLLQAALNWYTKSEELQKTIAQWIEMGVFFLQLGLGLAGGFAAVSTGALAAANLDLARKLSGAFATASTILGVGARVGKSVYEKQVSDYRALAKELDADLTAQNQEITQDTGQMSRRLQESEQMLEDLKNAVRHNRIRLD